MTTTGPRPPDIAFDHGAAARALAGLERAAAVLDDVGTVRSDASAVAREHFRGAYAEDFTTGDQDLGRDAGEARRAIGALHSEITAAMAAAQRAQAARSADQAAWDTAQAMPDPIGVA